MKPTVDQELCIGDGICEDLSPEVFELRDDGLAYVINEEPDESLWPMIKEAVSECPTDAIVLESYGSDADVAA